MSDTSCNVRVGRKIGKKVPEYPGFRKIVCLTKCSAYGEISPYALMNDRGQNMENLWQFQKVYPKVPRTVCRYSPYDDTVIWQSDAEIHVRDGKLTPQFFAWRKRGIDNPHAVRYPVGRSRAARASVLGHIKELPEGEFVPERDLLSWVDARKQIYVPLYEELVQGKPKFEKLKAMLAKGEKLLIIEIDGPHQEHLVYYKKKYGVDDDFIVDDTIEATAENMKIMLNDTKCNFGHGYCLAMALQGITKEVLDS